MTTDPRPQSELSALALDTARRCGVDVDALSGGDGATPLADQRRAGQRRWRGATRRTSTRRSRRAEEAFLAWRRVPAPARGALVKRFGELLAEHKDDLADPGQHRGREDHLRGARRDPGDDRHLRLRGRAVAPALRPDDALRAPRPPADGDLAPARRRRRDLRLQLPGRGLVVEHRRRPGLRRPGRLEALRAHPAHLAGLRTRCSPGRSPSTALPTALSQVLLGGPEVGQALVEHPGVALLSATGSTRMGRPSARGWPSGSAARCSSSAATTRPSSRGSADLDLAVRGIVFSAAGTAGQRCTTMRRVIAHTSVVDELDRPARLGVRPAADRQPDGRRHPRRPDDQPARRTTRWRPPSPRPPTTAASSWPAAVAALEDVAPDAYYVRPAIVRMDEQTDVVAQRDVRAAALRAALRRLRRGDRAQQRRARRVCRRASSPPTRPRPSCSCPPRAPTAASSTSTSAPPAPRSAARSAARRRPAAAASPARTRGAPTCAGRPTRSTSPASSRWPREWTSRSESRFARTAR